MASSTLVIEFSGRCMIRQPTDPDPYDETRGRSGYTFAFGDEPDLNRIIYFQPDPAFPLRSHCPPFGVRVDRAFVPEIDGVREIGALRNARVNLLGDPVLENRNWALTRPGYEPIVPFHLEIRTEDGALTIDRLDVLDPGNPDTPVWELPLSVIEAKGARGLAFEPQTVGHATGIYDSYLVAKERRNRLAADLKKLRGGGGWDSAAAAVLEGRISELDIGINAVESGKPDRRTAVYGNIERFGYFISGNPGVVEGDSAPLGGDLDLRADAKWRIDFWMGGWDFDALCAFAQGSVQIPFAAPAPTA